MPFTGNPDFNHDQPAKIGLLLTNLGSPAKPTRQALRKYLKQFLADPRIVELPRTLWWLILNGIILNTRPAKSARLYQSIWTDQGSPLAVHTRQQIEAISTQIKETLSPEQNSRLIIRHAMRYGEPSIDSVLQQMLQQGAEKLIVLPLYPQYAGSTTGSTFDALAHSLSKTRWLPELRFISHYHDDKNYIQACARRIEDDWQQHGRPEKLLFSFHGLPQSHLDNGDPYFCHCHKTARLIAESLNLNKSDYLIAFQSRFGKSEWLKPYTDQTLEKIAREGVKKVDVFCPGFASDCLETLEEIAVENKHHFLQAGGSEYHYIPALNEQPEHIEALTRILLTNIDDWLRQADRDQSITVSRHLEVSGNLGRQ